MSNLIPTNPDDIQKELESFIKDKFGNDVQIVTQQLFLDSPAKKQKNKNTERKTPEENTWDFTFNHVPKDIKSFLDQYVIQQNEAKKTLAIAICDHYNQIMLQKEKSASGHHYLKQNILLLGPTGVGKTYLIKTLAKLIGVPFVKADATRFSETGRRGTYAR